VEQAGRGPLWDNRLSVGAAGRDGTSILEAELADTLRKLGAARLIVGHAPTKALDYRLAWPHPCFGDRVALIDTGISAYFSGRLSAVEIADDLTVRYFERPGSCALAAERRSITKTYLSQIAE
jgi:hypothetical protein